LVDDLSTVENGPVRDRFRFFRIRIAFCLTSLFVVRWDSAMAYAMQRSGSETAQRMISTSPRPGAEMKKLAFLLGTWTASDIYEKSRFAPNGGSGSGIYKTVLGPGGFSLLTDYHYQGPHGKRSGHQMLTWDPKQGRYLGCIVTSDSAGSILVEGNWEGPDLVLSGNFESGGIKVSFREVFSAISSATMTLRQYNSIDGAPARLFGTTKFTKQ
jgi:Protein of unknown function (DUF1579)